MSNDLDRVEKILIEEIKMIQDVIKRMADNSFKIKTWAITLIVATLLIKSNLNNVFIAVIPLFAFWFLDAYYLQQERIFRMIYNEKVEKRTLGLNIDTAFKIDINKYKDRKTNILTLMFCNKSITILYSTILFLLILLGTTNPFSEVIKCVKNCL